MQLADKVSFHIYFKKIENIKLPKNHSEAFWHNFVLESSKNDYRNRAIVSFFSRSALKYLPEVLMAKFFLPCFYRKRMWTVSNAFIGALALSDLMFCTVTLPINLWEMVYEKWPFGEQTQALCGLTMAAQKFPIFFSSMSMVAIAQCEISLQIFQSQKTCQMK